MSRAVLIVSPEPYRADPRVTIQCVAATMARQGDAVTFVAAPSSHALRRGAGDAQPPADGAARTVDEVRLLTLDPWSSGSVGRRVRQWMALPSMAIPSPLDGGPVMEAARFADLVIVQAGTAAALIPRLRRAAPQALLTYVMTGDPIGERTPQALATLARHGSRIDRIVVTSRVMLPLVETFGERVTLMKPGLDGAIGARAATARDDEATDVVSFGSPPFDAAALHIAATALPHMAFHLCGATGDHRFPPNVHRHAAPGHDEVGSLLRRARLGFVPVVESDRADFFADASIELMWFEHHGIATACPHFAAGDHPGRIGYDAGRSASIRAALQQALALAEPWPAAPTPSWTTAVAATFGAGSRRASRSPVHDRKGAA